MNGAGASTTIPVTQHEWPDWGRRASRDPLSSTRRVLLPYDRAGTDAIDADSQRAFSSAAERVGLITPPSQRCRKKSAVAGRARDRRGVNNDATTLPASHRQDVLHP